MTSKRNLAAQVETASDVNDNVAPTSAEVRAKIEAAVAALIGERAALQRMASAREALFTNCATEDAIVEHDAHTNRLQIRVRLAEGAVRKLEDELAITEAAEADAARQALLAQAEGLKSDYADRLRRADSLAKALAIELHAAKEIEVFFESTSGLDVAELQDFRDDRPRREAVPAHVETIREHFVDDRPTIVGFVRAGGPKYVTRERQVEVPHRAAEVLPRLESLLKVFVLPALNATAEAHWTQPKPYSSWNINDIYSR